MHPHNRQERKLIGKLKSIKRVRKYRNDFLINQNEEEIKERIKNQLRKMRDTTKICSCPMCGNPRKFFGKLTIQEIKDKEFVESELQNLLESNKL